MRLWSIHPKFMDKAGLGALWREGLLARAVLADIERGDYSDPLCMRTPEQRAREALAPRKEKP